MYSLVLNKNEIEDLNNLVILNKRLEELWFSKDTNQDFIEMVDQLILEKLKNVDSNTAYRMLNYLFKHNLTETKGTELLVINNEEQDLATKRLAILLTEIVTAYDDFVSKEEKRHTKGFENYINANFLNVFILQNQKINYHYIIDHAELFLGLLNSNNNIDPEEKKRITKTFLYLYKDLYDDLQNKKLNKNSSIILSNRSTNLTPKIIAFKSCIIDTPFYQTTTEMLKITDTNLTEENINKLEIQKIYLDSFLYPLDEYETIELLDSYTAKEVMVDTEECDTALHYIYRSINEKTNMLEKEKTLSKC